MPTQAWSMPPAEHHGPGSPLSLEKGRKLYEAHITRPRVTGGVRESTRRTYGILLDKFLSFARSSGVTAWNRVTHTLLTEYAKDLKDRGRSDKTVSNELTLIKQVIKWMIEEGHLQGMKPIKMKIRTPESRPAYCYRREEVAAMIAHCRAHKQLGWLGDVIVALACTGMRISELVSLRWTDIDLKSKRLSLVDETGRSGKPISERRQLKSGRSRSFPIHPDLLALLEQMPRKEGYVFHGPQGHPVKQALVRSHLIRYVIAPLAERFPSQEGERGFQEGRLHSFRHYFCSVCANRGLPERILMDWLGHADSEMIRHYYHLHNEESQRRMEEMNFLGDDGGRSSDDE